MPCCRCHKNFYPLPSVRRQIWMITFLYSWIVIRNIFSLKESKKSLFRQQHAVLGETLAYHRPIPQKWYQTLYWNQKKASFPILLIFFHIWHIFSILSLSTGYFLILSRLLAYFLNFYKHETETDLSWMLVSWTWSNTSLFCLYLGHLSHVLTDGMVRASLECNWHDPSWKVLFHFFLDAITLSFANLRIKIGAVLNPFLVCLFV